MAVSRDAINVEYFKNNVFNLSISESADFQLRDRLVRLSILPHSFPAVCEITDESFVRTQWLYSRFLLLSSNPSCKHNN